MNRHYFWAVKIPDDVKRNIEAKLNDVKAHFPFQRWVHWEDYHITLAFLGFAEQQQLQMCSDGIEAKIRDLSSFKLDIVGLDIFGQASMPSVFWVAVRHEPQLLELQQVVHKQCLDASFELDKRKYKPHITLARKWTGKEPFEKNALTIHNPFTHSISFEANEVVLYTVYKDSIPKYEAVTTFTLKP